MALTAMAEEPAPRNSGIAMHYGFLPDTHVMLPVAESGGVSLEWFRRTCMGSVGYDEMNEVLLQRTLPGTLLFLPYLVGTNAPEFDQEATGVFYGLRQEHDVFDMAGAVMEGVSYMLRKNCDDIREKGTEITRIIATAAAPKVQSGASSRPTSLVFPWSSRQKKRRPVSCRPGRGHRRRPLRLLRGCGGALRPHGTSL